MHNIDNTTMDEESKVFFANVLVDILSMSVIIQPSLVPSLALECWGIRD
jgi:hypothetical protein